MKKRINSMITSVILVLLTSCGGSTQKTTLIESIRNPQLGEVQKSIKLSQVSEGQWNSEGNEYSSAQWLEFDSSKKEFYSWGLGEPKLTKASGTYEVIGDTVLQFFWAEHNETVKYGFDSINENYLDMWSYGVSTSHFIYKKKEYKPTHLKDISKDTITAKGKVIKADDLGWAYTYGLLIDTGNDTLPINYFTQEYSENSLRNKQVAFRYYKSVEYHHAFPKSQSEIFEITGTYNVLSYGGDLPGAYSVTDKNGSSVVFAAYLSKEDDKLEGTQVTERYTESYKINITSIEIVEPIMNTLIYGNWNVESSDSIVQGNSQIKIRPESETSVYIDFGQGENFYKVDIYSNVIEGANYGGKFKLELVSEAPAIFEYSDDGNGGHFEPIKKQRYSKNEGDFRKLLIGKWRHKDDPEGDYVEYTNKEIIANGERTPYVLSTVCMTDDYPDLNNDKPIYLSTIGGDDNSEDDSQKNQCWQIVNVTEDALATQYVGAGSYTIFKRVK